MNPYQQILRTPAGKEMLMRIEATLRDMFAKGHMEAPEFGRGLVSMAANWAVADNREAATRIITDLPDAYLQTDFRQQLLDDPDFRARADELARYLNILPAGYPTAEDQAIDTMLLTAPRAKA